VTSTYGHHRNPVAARRTYEGEGDYFAVYCPETAGVYLVPIEDVATRTLAKLRVEPTRNGQQKRVRHAAGYEIARIPVMTT